MSKIFTDTELKALERRKKGNRLDKTGIFAGRVKPKIVELLEVWFPLRRQLRKLISKKVVKKPLVQNDDEQTEETENGNTL